MTTDPALPVFDQTEALAYCDNDPELLRDIVLSFRATWPDYLAETRAGLDAGQATTVEQRAHKLKGRAATIGARAAAAAALRLEMLGQAGDLAGAESALVELRTALDALECQLGESYPT